MAFTVAGSVVNIGDVLYSRRAGGPGTIISVEDPVATLRVSRQDGSFRDFTVLSGGIVGGARDVYWNPAIELDLPKGQGAKMQKVEQVITTLLLVL